MKDPRNMTASEINRELDSLSKKDSRLNDELIEAGYGHVTPSEILKQSHPLAVRLRVLSDRRSALKSEILSRTGSDYRRMPTRRRNPPQSKTVDVFLPMKRAAATKWLRARTIPFTHMRELFNGVAFRIRRGYALDFQHEKDKSAPRYTNARKTAVRQATRRRRANPVKPWDRGRKFGVTLTSLHVRYFQGYAEDVRYTRAEDGKPYSHVVETDSAELYLCEDPTYGKCLLIVDPSGKTPLWG